MMRESLTTGGEGVQDDKKLKIMVSSTVYGIEELLNRIYTLLTCGGEGGGAGSPQSLGRG